MGLNIFRSILKRIENREEHFLFIVHLTKTIEPYITEWIKACKTIGIISIPYSENKEVRIRLGEFTNIYEVSDYRGIPNLIKSICIKHNDREIVLVEIGGYSATVSRYLKNVVVSAEDTAQGYWRFKEQEKKLSYPVVSIAKTDIKGLENKLVG